MEENNTKDAGGPDSADFGNVRKDSESFRNVPKNSEGFGSVPKASERKENHTLTVREVARMFEAAGVARTERSIINWCQPNKMGVARLECYFDPNERKYFITPQSVESAIAEEKAKAVKGGESAEPSGSLPKDSELVREKKSPRAEEDSDRAIALKEELTDLKITNRAKDYFIAELRKEREAFAEERQGYVEKLMTFTHKVGELETRLLQLEAPNTVDTHTPEDNLVGASEAPPPAANPNTGPALERI